MLQRLIFKRMSVADSGHLVEIDKNWIHELLFFSLKLMANTSSTSNIYSTFRNSEKILSFFVFPLNYC
jgi:hypothetical protein